jgi:hypothetical protein
LRGSGVPLSVVSLPPGKARLRRKLSVALVGGFGRKRFNRILETIYVALLDEDVDVWRPVEARREGGFYRIVGPVPETEKWAFDSGSLVRCEQRELSEGPVLVAVEAV